MTDTVVSAAEIESHITCPRRHEFEFERPVSLLETTRDRKWEYRRELLSKSIITGLQVDAESPSERVEAALTRFAELWRSSSGSYLVAEQAAYDKDATKTAIRDYLTGNGHTHGEALIEADRTLSFELDDVRYEARVDAIVKHEGRYLALRYVPSMAGILHVGWYDDNVQRFRNGDGFYPRQIGSLARAAIVLRGLMNEFGISGSYDFAYIGLLTDSRPSYTGTNAVHVDIEQRRFWSAYEAEKSDINALVAERAAAITEGDWDPRDWQFRQIIDHSCEYCPYQAGCPDNIESQMGFTDRWQSQEATSETQLFDRSSSEEGHQ